MRTALLKAIEILGGQSALARALGVRQGHVWAWLNRAERTPAEYALAIEAATKGQVTRHELRPDIYPVEEGGAVRSPMVAEPAPLQPLPADNADADPAAPIIRIQKILERDKHLLPRKRGAA